MLDECDITDPLRLQTMLLKPYPAAWTRCVTAAGCRLTHSPCTCTVHRSFQLENRGDRVKVEAAANCFQGALRLHCLAHPRSPRACSAGVCAHTARLLHCVARPVHLSVRARGCRTCPNTQRCAASALLGRSSELECAGHTQPVADVTVNDGEQCTGDPCF